MLAQFLAKEESIIRKNVKPKGSVLILHKSSFFNLNRIHSIVKKQINE